MTIRKLASLVAKKEGKKSQVHIGNIREILSVLSDLVNELGWTEVMDPILDNAHKRAKRRKK